MGSFAEELARRALQALPLPSRVRHLVEEWEPKARARLESLGRRLVDLGEQLQGLAGPALLAAGRGTVQLPATPRSAPPRVERTLVTFSVSHAGTTFGEGVYVCGDQEALGRWDPRRALPLTYQEGGADGTWSGQVQLPAGVDFQYQYLRWSSALPSATARWEANQPTRSGNREARSADPGAEALLADGRFRFG